MPKLKSAKKRLTQNRKTQRRNRAVRSTMRSAIKAVRQASDQAAGQGALLKAISIIDKTAKKGVVHKNTAARYKSRLSRQVRKMA